MTATVHFVYPHGSAISCPDAIGRRVSEALRRDYEVREYEWDDTGVIRPRRHDILLGHPHPAPWTIFRRSARCVGWSRIVAMFPYSHGDTAHAAFAERSVRVADSVIAITGPYWAERIHSSQFSHWIPKVTFVDLAVDRDDFPRIKGSFNPPGQRKVLYIGNSSWTKNPRYLEAIAAHLDGEAMRWMGEGLPIPGLRSLGYFDFRESESKQLVSEHDFTITVSESDANPATVLESMAWGLVPVCTPQSGYEDVAGIVNVPSHNAAAAAAVLRRLQFAPEADLECLRRRNDHALSERFTWERFTDRVLATVASDASPSLLPAGIRRRGRIAFVALVSKNSPLRRPHLRLFVKRLSRGSEVY